MKKVLPQFPRISRVITEDIITLRTFFILKLLLISLISMMLVYLIIREGFALPQNAAQARFVQADSQKLNAELTHWKKIADQYAGYRDVYYRIASLEYSKGNVEEAKKYLQKALEVDPNFDAGKVLGEKIKL